MTKPMKSIEKQQQDIVKYTSLFKDVTLSFKQDKLAYIITCPDALTEEVLRELLKNHGYEGETIINFYYTFRIKLLEPTITPEQLVLKMVEYLRTLDNTTNHPTKLSARSNAATELLKFLASIGIDEKLFD